MPYISVALFTGLQKRLTLDHLTEHIIMTRTERAAFPAAVVKDHAVSKTGLNNRTPKGGAGPNNWGSLENERELEDAAAADEVEDFANAGGASSTGMAR